MLKSFGDELATVLIVSQAEVVCKAAPEGCFTETESGISVAVAEADGEKCDRCWMHSTKGKKTEEGFICFRCQQILGE